jgi:Flp pilus assembly protein TadD
VFSLEQAEFLEKALAVEPHNFETALALGEAWRMQSQAGNIDSREKAEKAMGSFGIALKLNPWDAGAAWRYGWCLDWLERREEATAYFEQAELLDGNSYYIVANLGVHYIGKGNYPLAREFFERSARLKPSDNPIAVNYLHLVTSRMMDAAQKRLPVEPKKGT